MPPKRIKVKCSVCSKIFDSDYKKRHQNAVHDGQNVKVHPFIDSELKRSNPFELASRKKVSSCEFFKFAFDS